MGLSDVRSKVVPNMTLIAPPREGGHVATRTFIPHKCHAAIGVLGAVTVGIACVLSGSVATGIATVPSGAVKQLSVEHPTGESLLEIEVDEEHTPLKIVRSSLIRTARALFRGSVLVRASVWKDRRPALRPSTRRHWSTRNGRVERNRNSLRRVGVSRAGVDYADAVDTQEYARLRDIFVEDAAFTRPANPQELIHGVENIVAMFESRPRNRLTQHIVSNIRVRVESADRAVGTCRVLLFTSDVSDPGAPDFGRKASARQLIGTYKDRYVRTKNGWRFAERRGTISFHT